MSMLQRVGRVLVVVAVIFFLSVSFALAGMRASRAPREAGAGLPVDVVLGPVKVVKEIAVGQARALRAGQVALVDAGLRVLDAAIAWLRTTGFARVRVEGDPAPESR
jgi:hypothetical protein